MKVPIKKLHQAISQKSKIISLLSAQIKLLERLVHEVFSCRDQIFFPLSTGIFDVSRELVHLSQGNHINALYMVSRSFLERAVNILYLDCSSDEERISFSTHSIQKGARSLKRRVTAGPLTYELKSTAYEEYLKIPEIQKAVTRFSSQKGSEITRWTKLNILERIENIHFNTKAKAKLFLLFALHVYDDSSEALHGTSYEPIPIIGKPK